MMLKYWTSTSLSFIASRAAASARTLKPTMRAFEAAASCTSEMVMPPTPLAMIFTATSSVDNLFSAQRLGASLHVGLEQDRNAARLLLFHLREHVAHLRGLLREFDVAELALAIQRDFARLAFVFHREELVARI